MEDIGDIDLEELESRLYSQVYHSAIQDYEQSSPFPLINNNTQSSKTYYQKTNKHSNNLRNIHESATTFDADPSTIPNSSTGSPYQIVLNPINNFVVVPESNVKRSNKIRKKNSNRSRRSRERFFQKKSEMKLTEKGERRLSMMKKKVNQFDKLISLFKRKKEKDNGHDKTTQRISFPEVINLSDTDGEDCVIIPEKRPLVYISDCDETSPASCAEKKSSITNSLDTYDDDVVIIEPPPPEIICIDMDDADDCARLESEQGHIEQGSKQGALDQYSFINFSEDGVQEKAVIDECNASNDFLESSSEVNKDNFNFGLHGSDFNGEFIKPANPCESYESASSCSTSDFNPPLKPVVFNTIDFPKEDLFCEGNLESFSKLITPKRKSSLKNEQNNKTVIVEPTNDNDTPTNKSSDSSSESDYEDNMPVTHCNKKKLPDLSNMNCDDKVSESSKNLKGNQKHKHLKRKLEMDETPKKKTKKKRSSTCITEEVDNPVTTPVSNRVISLTPTKKVKDKAQHITEVKVGEAQELTTAIVSKKETVCTSSQITSTKTKNKLKDGVEEKNDSHQVTTRLDLPKTGFVQVSKSPKVVINDDAILSQGSNSHAVCEESENTELQFRIDKVPAIVEQDELVVVDSSENNPSTFGPKVDLQINFTRDRRQREADTVCLEDISKNYKRTSFSNVWSPNKTVFYATPIDVTNHDTKQIQDTMSDNPALWKICSDDRFPKPTQNRGPRCLRCRNFGHLSHRCPNRSIICSICAVAGHLHHNCRVSLCKQCGDLISYRGILCKRCLLFRNKFCTLCRVRGHSNAVCPDLWRRYHLTTQKGLLKKAEAKTFKPASQLWCSCCAKSGHLEASCAHSSHPQSIMYIKSYEDVYNGQESSVRESYSLTAGQATYTADRQATISTVPSEDVLNANAIPVGESSNLAHDNTFIPLLSYKQQHPSSTTTSSSLATIPPLMNNSQIFSLDDFSNIGSLLLTNLQNIQNALLQVPQRLSNIPLLNYQNGRPVMGHSEHLEIHGRQAYINQPAQPINSIDNNSTGVPHTDDIYKIISFQPLDVVQQFLRSEFQRLDNFRCDPIALRRKVSQLENLVRTNGCYRDSLDEHYMNLNMLVFGTHRLLDGNKHLTNLRKFLNWPLTYKLRGNRRRGLWESYNYIFGKVKHAQNYYRLLHVIINKR